MLLLNFKFYKNNHKHNIKIMQSFMQQNINMDHKSDQSDCHFVKFIVLPKFPVRFHYCCLLARSFWSPLVQFT